MPIQFSRGLRLAAGLFLLPVWSIAAGQTLGGEYERYLNAKCQNMNFERGDGQELVAGQAGPNLFAYCTGPYSLPSGGGAISDVSLGASGTGTNGGAKEEAALRRRRDRARSAEEAESGDDFSLLEGGGHSLFLSMDYLRQDQKQTDYQDGRDTSNYIASLGYDKRLGSSGVVGVIARYTAQSGRINAGGNFRSRAIGATLYGSWLPLPAMFIDVSAGLDDGHAKIRRIVARQETSSVQGPSYGYIDPVTGQVVIVVPPPVVTVYYNIPPARAAGATDSLEAGANLQAGYDVALGRYSIGPRAAAQWKSSATDAFVEAGNTPMTLAFDRQKQTSLRSTAGLQASMVFNTQLGVFVTQANADWIHEHGSDQKLNSARFAQDYRPEPSRLQFLTQAPDRDFFEGRLSLVAVLPHGTSLFLSMSSSFGNRLLNQYGATLGVRAEL